MQVVNDSLGESEIIRNIVDLKNTIERYDFMLYMGVKGVPIKNIWDITENPSWTQNLSPWLDELIIHQDAVYPLIIKGRAGIVSRKDFPYFYKAKSAHLDLNKAEAEQYYQAGVMSRESFKILEALEHKPMSVSELRVISNTCGKDGKSVFDKAMMELKQSFAIVKVDIIKKGWGENIFALTHKIFEDDIKQARDITIEDAYSYIIMKYLRLYEVIDIKFFCTIFDFNIKEIEEVIEKLYSKGKVNRTTEGRKILYSAYEREEG